MLPIVISGVAILTVATCLVKQEERIQTKQQTIESQQKTIQDLRNQLKKKSELKLLPLPATTVQTPEVPKEVQKPHPQPATTVQTPEVPKVELKKSPDITEGA